MTLWHVLPIILLAGASMIQTWFMARLSDKVRMLEQSLRLKDWIDAINAGESLSDIAYMREKGFIR